MFGNGVDPLAGGEGEICFSFHLWSFRLNILCFFLSFLTRSSQTWVPFGDTWGIFWLSQSPGYRYFWCVVGRTWATWWRHVPCILLVASWLRRTAWDLLPTFPPCPPHLWFLKLQFYVDSRGPLSHLEYFFQNAVCFCTVTCRPLSIKHTAVPRDQPAAWLLPWCLTWVCGSIIHLVPNLAFPVPPHLA